MKKGRKTTVAWSPYPRDSDLHQRFPHSCTFRHYTGGEDVAGLTFKEWRMRERRVFMYIFIPGHTEPAAFNHRYRCYDIYYNPSQVYFSLVLGRVL